MLTRPIMPSDQRGRETIGERSRNSLIRSEVQSEAISPLLSPDIRRTKARQAVRSRNFFRQDNDNRLGSQSQLSSLQSPHLGHYLPNWQREWGKRSSNHTQIEDSFRNTSLNEEYTRLTAALESQKRALSGLKLKRSQTLGISEGKSEAAILRLIEVSRLQRLKKSFQARYYTASQKIENTKRRISKIKNGFKVKEGKQSTDQEYSFYKNCSETQLRELLDCERLEFKAKLEFEISFNELLSKKLAKLESLEQSKSLILRIIDDRDVQKEGEFTKVFEKMRENKNTMTTEKIVMINKPSLSQQNVEHSAGILLHDKGESEQTYNPPKVGNLTFSNKRIAVKVLPEIKVSHHKRTYSEDIPRDNFLAVRPAEVRVSS